MLRLVVSAVFAVLVLVACDSAPSTSVPTTTSITNSTFTTSSTTTTIPNDDCELVMVDTVSFLDALIRVLDDIRLADFTNLAAWPEDLIGLKRTSRDLDLRVGVLRCDATAIWQRALDEARLVPGSPLSEGLIEVLLAPSATTATTIGTTSTEASDTTATSP